jgi:dsDNA-specific endonuclease/ATPase MutS2
MKKLEFNIGHQVAVIDDVIKGIIVFINGNKITIRDENDFQFVYDKSELIQYDSDDLFNQNKHFVNIDKNKKTSSKFTKKQIKNKKTTLLEVDLHIHHLTHSNQKMTNFEMLQIQLNTVKIKVDYAIKHNIQRVVFIHGVGKGKLKSEIYHLLKKYPVEINDASFKKYGFGATEIYIFKNPKENI